MHERARKLSPRRGCTPAIKMRTCHDVTADGVDVARPYGRTHIADGDGETGGHALLGGVCRQRVLRLRHADGQVGVARLGIFLWFGAEAISESYY